MSKSISPGTLEPRTYADGYGIWHAIIPCDTPEPGKVAARLIMKELALRGEIGSGYRVTVTRDTLDPEAWLSGSAHHFVEV